MNSSRFKIAVAIAALVTIAVAGLALLPDLKKQVRALLPASVLVELNGFRLGYRVDNSIRMSMPDGVRLAASLYLPLQHGDRGIATIFIRHPYGRLLYREGLEAAQYFASQGYAVIVQDIRGKYDSEGEFIPYRFATSDGAASLDWIASQAWSNGRVGSFGCSALGELQFSLARARHPAHAAMIPMGAGGALGSALGRYSYFGVYEGGIFQLASGFGWFLNHGAKRPGTHAPVNVNVDKAIRGLPISALVGRISQVENAYKEFVSSPLDAPFWRTLDYVSTEDILTTPMLVVNTWGDQTIGDTLAMAEFVRQTTPDTVNRHHRMIIAPGNHCDHDGIGISGKFGEIRVQNAQQPYSQLYLAWFDYWLRSTGDGLVKLPAFTFFMIGEDRWRNSNRWPPESARTVRWYLVSDGSANTAAGTGRLATLPASHPAYDEFHYDPLDPVPSRGGPLCCTGNPTDHPGPADQHEVEQRQDVLVYTSAPLTEPLRIAGNLSANLFVSSSGPDTDFVARLVHVWPDGRATSIQEGALRARFRDGIQNPALLTPGQIVSIRVDMRAIAYQVPAGHRLRLDIASSSFPRLERNLNTGGENSSAIRGNIVANRLYQGGRWASNVELQSLPLDP